MLSSVVERKNEADKMPYTRERALVGKQSATTAIHQLSTFFDAPDHRSTFHSFVDAKSGAAPNMLNNLSNFESCRSQISFSLVPHRNKPGEDLGRHSRLVLLFGNHSHPIVVSQISKSQAQKSSHVLNRSLVFESAQKKQS